MKKVVVLLLACLWLAGCGAQPAADSSEPTPQASVDPQPEAVGLYDPGSAVEEATGGAVRAYPLGDGEYTGMIQVGDRLLVVSAEGDITLLEGDNCLIVATAATELDTNWTAMELRSNGNSLAYYAPQTHEVVILDSELQELSRVPLPEQSLGKPAIHLEQNEIFYCVGSEIRALNIQTGISRLVRSHSCQEQALIGSYFNDTVLGCLLTDELGQQKIIYLYAQTGQVVEEDTTLGSLQTLDRDYFAIRTDSNTRQVLFGNAEEETMCLHTDGPNLTAALALGGAVNYDTVNQSLFVEFFDFDSGKRAAEVTLDNVGILKAIHADQNYLWLLCGQVLYRWDVTASATTDETVYTGPLYTAASPDIEGLAKCRAKADILSQTYGISIRLWEDAKDPAYGVETEYHVSVIDRALDKLEETLSSLPEGFLTTTGNLRVDLVRSIAGREAVQYRSGSTLCMILPCEDVQYQFLWGLGCAVDTRVLGNSRDYDFWDDRNPKGFAYTYNYEENAAREDADQYLDGESRAFTDLTAMSFPTEDRARIFANAILADNEDMFQSKIMSSKLQMLCEAIREAYGLDDSTEVFPWEQYLKNPLAKPE